MIEAVHTVLHPEVRGTILIFWRVLRSRKSLEIFQLQAISISIE